MAILRYFIINGIDTSQLDNLNYCHNALSFANHKNNLSNVHIAPVEAYVPGPVPAGGKGPDDFSMIIVGFFMYHNTNLMFLHLRCEKC